MTVESNYEKYIIETLIEKVMEKDGEIGKLRSQVLILEKLLEDEKAKNKKLEDFFTLREADEL